MGVTRVAGLALTIGLLAITTGCIPALPLRHLSVEEPRQETIRPALGFQEASEATPDRLPDLSPAGAVESSLALDELLAIAVKHHPDLKAAHARIEIARGRLIQAGLYPNFSIGPNFAQLNDNANRTGEMGARFIQNFVRPEKIRTAKAAAASGVEAADWQALTQWYAVVTRVRFAYFDLLTAQREQETMNDIADFSTKAYKTALSLEKAGTGARPDVLRAKVELEQNNLKMHLAAQRVQAAEQKLLTALGRPAVTLNRTFLKSKALDSRPPEYDWQAMLTCLHDSSAELNEARALISQQEKLLARARAEVRPDVLFTAVPFYESFAREMRCDVFMTWQMPIFNRNQGNIHAAQNDLALSWAFERQLELQLTEKLIAAYQRYQGAVKQVDVYRRIIVPGAEESLKLVEAGYAGGDKKYDYTALLQAQQVLAQTKLAHTLAIGELWRSVVEIAGILQQQDLMSGCAVTPRRL